MDRQALIDERNRLMAIVDKEREWNKQNRVMYLSLGSRKLLDKIWNIDERIMQLT